LIKNLYKLNM